MWKKFLNLFTVLALFSFLIAPVGRVSAQESGPGGKNMHLRSAGDEPTVSQENATPGTSGDLKVVGNLVQDPGFEASFDFRELWGQFSTNFVDPSNLPTPLCTFSWCGSAGGAAGPRTGNVWAWLGGADFAANPNLTSPEVSQVWQNVTFPSCSGQLQFYLWIGQAGPGSDGNDIFLVGIDGIAIFAANATQRSTYPSYQLVSLDVSQYADGGVHLVQFFSRTFHLVSFHVDDISLTGTCRISGNAGVAGASINYTDGSTSADGNGNYAFNVPLGWSGTVTPSLACRTFNPAQRTYSNVVSNQTAQNYTATVGAASGCSSIGVQINGVPRGSVIIPKNGASRLSFPLNSGPVLVSSTNNVPFVASERVIFPKNSPTTTNFSEMIGLPANLRTTKYYFPVYDNSNFDSQLRFANVGQTSTTVIVKIQGIERSRDTLAPNQSMRRSYFLPNGTPVSAGPLVIESTNSAVPIIASLRVITRPINGSFSEMMGLPQSQAGNSYFFSWYNNVNLDSQLRVANIGTGTTTVTVTIGSVVRSVSVALNDSVRISIPNVNAGPVKVTGLGKIVASMRITPKGNASSFSELMGLPQLATTYHFPWYNNVNLDTQLRVANMSAATASVRVFIAGQEVTGSPFSLAPGASTRKSFAVNNGPMKVISNQLIVASLRVLFSTGGTPTAFSELMGLPQSQLTTGYYFPWYNNVDLNTQLRFGVP